MLVGVMDTAREGFAKSDATAESGCLKLSFEGSISLRTSSLVVDEIAPLLRDTRPDVSFGHLILAIEERKLCRIRGCSSSPNNDLIRVVDSKNSEQLATEGMPVQVGELVDLLKKIGRDLD